MKWISLQVSCALKKISIDLVIVKEAMCIMTLLIILYIFKGRSCTCPPLVQVIWCEVTDKCLHFNREMNHEAHY